MQIRDLRPRIPIWLPITGVLLPVVGLTIGPFIRAPRYEEELAQKVLLSVAPFILVLVAILFFFISLVWLAATAFSHQSPRRIYRPDSLPHFPISEPLLTRKKR